MTAATSISGSRALTSISCASAMCRSHSVAKGHVKADFALAAPRARQEHICEIRASDQEDECCRGHQELHDGSACWKQDGPRTLEDDDVVATGAKRSDERIDLRLHLLALARPVARGLRLVARHRGDQRLCAR